MLSQVTGAFYTFVQPTPANGDPTLVAASEDVAALLDLDVKEFGTAEFLRCFAGVELPRAWKPWAQCYGGHQFGALSLQACVLRNRTLRQLHRLVGGAAGRRPRYFADGGCQRKGRALGASAEGRWQDAVLSARRRPRGAAIQSARVCRQRSYALAWRPHDACAFAGAH